MHILKNKMKAAQIYVYTFESSQDSDRQHLEVNTMESKGEIPV